jgi:hypothetical protein
MKVYRFRFDNPHYPDEKPFQMSLEEYSAGLIRWWFTLGGYLNGPYDTERTAQIQLNTAYSAVNPWREESRHPYGGKS